MRNLILGAVLALLLVAIGTVIAANLGMLPTTANSDPPRWERRFAMGALDAAVERHAPRVSNPLPKTDENMIDGMKLYTMNCAVCHGGLDQKPATLAHSLYPPAPQVIMQPMDDPEWRTFYVIRTGARYTGMPAWDKALSEQEIWKVTAFLSNLNKLSPGVQDYWKKASGVAPPSASDEQHDHAHHDDADHQHADHEHEHDEH
jgi:mono/diheme cytochrome c family protein